MTSRHSSVDRKELSGSEILAHAIEHNFAAQNDSREESRIDAHRLMSNLEYEIGREYLTTKYHASTESELCELIQKHDVFQTDDSDAMTAQSWLWPDRTIGKRESRQLREEHNAAVNQLADLLESARLLQKAIRDAGLLNVKKHFDICVTDAAVSKAIHNATKR